MPTYAPIIEYADNTTLSANQITDMINSVATFLNQTKIASDNVQTGGLIGSNLAANTVTGDRLNSNCVDNSTLAFSGNQLQVKAGGITTTQISAAAGITGSQLANTTITAAQIANSTITRTQLSSGGALQASSSGIVSTTSSTYSDVANQSITVTTSGRPVLIVFNTPSDAAGLAGSSSAYGIFQVLRDSTIVHSGGINGPTTWNYPASVFNCMDLGAAAGTHTYKLQFRATAGTFTISNTQMSLIELF